MENYPHESGDEEYYEDEYFADCEVDINGTLITPENTLVHLYQPHCWDALEFEDDDQTIHDVIVEEFVIKAMINSGFHFKEHGAPSEAYREWYVLSVLKPMDAELQAFYDEL